MMFNPEEGWELGADGRYFRKFGRYGIEYEPEVTIGGVAVPASKHKKVLEDLRRAEEDLKRKQEEKLRKKSLLGSCPFKSGRKCNMDCAFYSEDGCMETDQTLGKRCPLSNYNCNEECMLYQDGCQIIKKWSENK